MCLYVCVRESESVCGWRYEKVLGEAKLSGVNSRLSGYNLHVSLDLETNIPTEAQLTADTNYTEGTINAYHHPNAYYGNEAIQVLCYMHLDKSLILTSDTVQVSE